MPYPMSLAAPWQRNPGWQGPLMQEEYTPGLANQFGRGPYQDTYPVGMRTGTALPPGMPGAPPLLGMPAAASAYPPMPLAFPRFNEASIEQARMHLRALGELMGLEEFQVPSAPMGGMGQGMMPPPSYAGAAPPFNEGALQQARQHLGRYGELMGLEEFQAPPPMMRQYTPAQGYQTPYQMPSTPSGYTPPIPGWPQAWRGWGPQDRLQY
jgi:hypothetical protein